MANHTKITFVERPIGISRGVSNETQRLHNALIETATNGKAVEINLNGKKGSNVSNRLRYTLARRGYKVHARVNTENGSVVCWTEAIKEGD